MNANTSNKFHEAVKCIEKYIVPQLITVGYSWKFLGGDKVHEQYSIKDISKHNTVIQKLQGKIGLLGYIIDLKNPSKKILVQPHFLKNPSIRSDKPNNNIPANFIKKYNNNPTKIIPHWYEIIKGVDLYFLLMSEKFFVLNKFSDFKVSDFSVQYRNKNKLFDRFHLKDNEIPMRYIDNHLKNKLKAIL